MSTSFEPSDQHARQAHHVGDLPDVHVVDLDSLVDQPIESQLTANVAGYDFGDFTLYPCPSTEVPESEMPVFAPQLPSYVDVGHGRERQDSALVRTGTLSNGGGGGGVSGVARRGSKRENWNTRTLNSRRQRQLQEAGNDADFSKQNLHKLFRIFDRDHDNKIKQDEFQAGLIAMGLEHATDAEAVGRLFQRVDVEREGYLSESEFVSFFRTLKKDQLQSSLKALSATETNVEIKVVMYDGATNVVGDLLLSPTEFAEWLEKHKADILSQAHPLRRYWCIFSGFPTSCDEVLDLLGFEFGIHQEMYQDVVTVQRDKIEVSDSGIVQILFGMYTLVNSPFSGPNGQSSSNSLNMPDIEDDEPRRCGCCFSRSWRMSSGHLSQLASSTQLNGSNPIIHSHPLSNIVVNNSFLLTIVRDPPQHRPRTQGGYRHHQAENPAYAMLNDVFLSIVQRAPDIMSREAKYLAYLILEAGMDYNYDLRDQLVEWHWQIDQGIAKRSKPFLKTHLYQFSKVAGAYVEEMSGLGQQLESIAWDGTGDVARALQNEAVFFKDLGEVININLAHTTKLLDTVPNLFRLYQSGQDEEMNRILYLLTLVTTIFIPCQLLTGVFGMNFANMPELGWNHGYLMFWLIVLGLTILISFWFKYMGFWTMISRPRARQRLD
eukprot:m.156770 g.156770  ORF g.156770 m.156770 type:complete len:661 (+) comp14331_c2_seq6:365-2347(+)